MNLALPNRRERASLRLGKLALVLATAALVSLAIACGDSKDDNKTSTNPTAEPTKAAVVNGGVNACPAAAEGASTSLSGAGATFPNPLYTKWISEYEKLCGTKINYNSVGSGAGIQQITAKTVDYGASDGIMTEAQESAAVAAGGPVLHIPMTFAAVTVAYNLPGVATGQLKLDGPTLANIFLGNIKKWDDPAIKALNGSTPLSGDIVVAHRSDGSGTTFIFSNYLSKVSPEWQTKVGFATTITWPTGVGGQGNAGVAGVVKQTPGAIGYVDIADAQQAGLTIAQMKNKSGSYITPSLESATAAATGVTLPADAKALLTDTSNAQGYPITGFTWTLAFVNAQDPAKGKALAYYLWWAIHDAQKFNGTLGYAALSPDAVKVAETEILSLKCGAAACLTKTAQ